MKKIIFLIFLSMGAQAAELNITGWFRLNRDSNTDLAAEVCFSLTPKPTRPVYAEVFVDKGTNSAGLYSTWIGPKGVNCHVVSTVRGTVEVSIPALNLKQTLTQ